MELDPIPDDTVGSILVHAYEEEVVDEPPSSPSTTHADLECRLVYASRENQDKPYYMTHTQNKIYVVDPTRIDYFPERNVLPGGLVGRVHDFRLPKKAKTPKKLGYITIQVPQRSFNKVEFVQQKRDVFKEEDPNEEIYYTICGPRRLRVEKERVHFVKFRDV